MELPHGRVLTNLEIRFFTKRTRRVHAKEQVQRRTRLSPCHGLELEPFHPAFLTNWPLNLFDLIRTLGQTGLCADHTHAYFVRMILRLCH